MSVPKDPMPAFKALLIGTGKGIAVAVPLAFFGYGLLWYLTTQRPDLLAAVRAFGH